MDQLDEIQIPGKSTLQRYGQWLPEADMREVIDALLTAGVQTKDEDGHRKLELFEELDLDSYFLDTTCVKLNIHFPNALYSSCASRLGAAARRSPQDDESDHADW